MEDKTYVLKNKEVVKAYKFVAGQATFDFNASIPRWMDSYIQRGIIILDLAGTNRVIYLRVLSEEQGYRGELARNGDYIVLTDDEEYPFIMSQYVFESSYVEETKDKVFVANVTNKIAIDTVRTHLMSMFYKCRNRIRYQENTESDLKVCEDMLLLYKALADQLCTEDELRLAERQINSTPEDSSNCNICDAIKSGVNLSWDIPQLNTEILSYCPKCGRKV